MKRDGFDTIVSNAVSHALGIEVSLIGRGSGKDGRYCFSDTQKSQCYLCSVSFLKEHVDTRRWLAAILVCVGVVLLKR